MSDNPSGLRIFLVGNRGYASSILKSLIENQENLVGVCCRNYRSESTIKKHLHSFLICAGLYRKECFLFKDPFGDFEAPDLIASRHHVPVLYAKYLHTSGFETALRKLNPDLILVAGFHRLIPNNVIEIPRKAIINLHPSFLPRHRGGTPNRWVIRYGERETGVTAHFVNERFDCGDLILQEKLAVRPNETWGELELRSMKLAGMVVYRLLDLVKQDQLKGTPQTNENASHDPPFNKENTKIDWSLPAQEIKQLCYAIRPKSGGMTCLNEHKLCIWDLEVLDDANSDQRPGTVVEMDQEGYPVVCCGEGRVRILSFLQTGRILQSRKVVKRLSIRAGQIFC